jgi:HEAT repeat protein
MIMDRRVFLRRRSVFIGLGILASVAALWVAFGGPLRTLLQRQKSGQDMHDNTDDFDERVPAEVCSRLEMEHSGGGKYAFSPRHSRRLRELVRSVYAYLKNNDVREDAPTRGDGTPENTIYLEHPDLTRNECFAELSFADVHYVDRGHVTRISLRLYRPEETVFRFEVPTGGDVDRSLTECCRRIEKDVPTFIAELRSEHALIRMSNADCLGYLGPKSKPAVPALTRLLTKDSDWRVRLEAARALIKIGGRTDEVVRCLIREMQGKDPRQRQEAVTLVCYLRNDAGPALPSVSRCLTDSAEDVRISAAATVESLGPIARPTIPTLVEALTGPLEPKYLVLRALKAVGPSEESIAGLITFATSEAGEASEATKILGDFGEPARVAIPALTKELRRKDLRRSLQAAATLIRLGGEVKASVAVLREGLRSPDLGDRLYAVGRVEQLGGAGSPLMPELERLLTDENDEVRKKVKRVLQQIRQAKKKADIIL